MLRTLLVLFLFGLATSACGDGDGSGGGGGDGGGGGGGDGGGGDRDAGRDDGGSGLDAGGDDGGGGGAEGVDTSAFDGLLAFRGAAAKSPAWVRDLAANEFLATIEPEGELPDIRRPVGLRISAEGTELAFAFEEQDIEVKGFLASEGGILDLASAAVTAIPRTVDGRPDAVRHAFWPQPNDDGTVVAFRELVHDDEDDVEGLGLYDDGAVRTVVADVDINSLRITADGSTVFYVSDGGRALYRVSLPDGTPTEVDLTDHPDCDGISLDQGGIDWQVSDDGNVLAYTGSLADSDAAGVFILTDGTIYRAGDIEGVIQVDVSGDGSTVAAAGVLDDFDEAVQLADADGSNLTAVELGSDVLGIALSDDGSQLAYATVTPEYPQGAIYLVKRDGSDKTLVMSADQREDFSARSSRLLHFR